jgi:hypothetical protein
MELSSNLSSISNDKEQRKMRKEERENKWNGNKEEPLLASFASSIIG